MDLIQYIGSIGGITGVLAFCMFLVYRQDKKATENRLDKITESYNEAMTNNTKILSELYTWLKMKNGHKE